MARRRSERLKVLQRLADRYEQLAAQDLGKSQGNLQQQRMRLQELVEFRQEYTQQFQRNGMQGIDGSAIQAFQNFMMQLDNIIEQQKQTILMAEADCEVKKDHWQDKHKTTRIYDKTVEKVIESEAKQTSRAEQRESDDRSQHIKDTQT